MLNSQYTITIHLLNSNSNSKSNLTIVGFCANERNENTISRHLLNVCKHSKGNLFDTHQLLIQLVSQWQESLNVCSSQILRTIDNSNNAAVQNVNLYKQQLDNSYKLLNTFYL